MAPLTTGNSTAFSLGCWGLQQRYHQFSASLALNEGVTHENSIMRKALSCHDINIWCHSARCPSNHGQERVVVILMSLYIPKNMHTFVLRFALFLHVISLVKTNWIKYVIFDETSLQGLVIHMGHSGYGLSQWERTLHCNTVSHWLGPYTEWSLKQDYSIAPVRSKLSRRIRKNGVDELA